MPAVRRSVLLDSKRIDQSRHVFNDKQFKSVPCPSVKGLTSLHCAPGSEIGIFHKTQVEKGEKVCKLIDGLFTGAAIARVTADNAGIHQILENVREGTIYIFLEIQPKSTTFIRFG
jgi:hypothetical protein